MRSMLDSRHDLASGCSIRAKLIRDDALRQASLLLYQPDQQTLGSLIITPALDDFIENIAILIDGAPQLALRTTNRSNDFIQVPHSA